MEMAWYDPITYACRYNLSSSVSILLDIGVRIENDSSSPDKDLAWYKKYIDDDDVDVRLTALLPLELNARTNKAIRDEEAACRAEEEARRRLKAQEVEQKRKDGAKNCVRCSLLFFPSRSPDDPSQPGPCNHHCGTVSCSQQGRDYDTGSDYCCTYSCCRRRRSEARIECATLQSHSVCDQVCKRCGHWREASETTPCVVHTGRWRSRFMVSESSNVGYDCCKSDDFYAKGCSVLSHDWQAQTDT